jgi:hypothetical protein
MCGSCGRSGGGITMQQNPYNPPTPVDTNCAYTFDQITIWKNKLSCIKNNGLFNNVGVNEYTINSYLGICLSALNSGQICYFSSYFDSMVSLIQAISQQTTC